MDINQCVLMMKNEIELSIRTATNGGTEYTNGSKAKESLIRSGRLIGYLHECIKHELVRNNVNSNNIFPPIGDSRPELKVTGFLKQKKQDVAVVPSNIEKEAIVVDWGPLADEGVRDNLGLEYTSNCLIINVRSQLSSLAKNTDTLFERTFAEALNLHAVYKRIVLGEVYIIPVYEYNEAEARNNRVAFSPKKTNLKKYISFFTAISGRADVEVDEFKYERCALLIVDFSREIPKIYSSTDELKADGLVDADFGLELADISFNSFANDILNIYGARFDLANIVITEN